jgi:hypothetical protein
LWGRGLQKWSAALEHSVATLQPEKLKIGTVALRLGLPGFLVGAIALVAAAWVSFSNAGTVEAGASVGDFSDLTTHFFHAYLAAYVFYVSISLGALAFVMIQHLTRAGWSVTVRRVAEGLGLNMFLLVPLAMPFFIKVNGIDGAHRLFPHWFMPLDVQHDATLLAKGGYLNPQAFAIRMGVYFVFWGLLAWYLAERSARQDRSGSPRLTLWLERLSAPAIILFAFSLTAFIVDWVMALQPHWFSSIFGVYYFAGCMLSALSAIVLLLLTLQKRGLIGDAVNEEHYHDLGKLMFAFTFFWGYIAFSQYMLIWYSNMPEETQFYIPRQWGPWASVSILLLIVHLVIPFAGLMSRGGKRRPGILAFWAVWSLAACALDICWLVLPNEWINRLGEWAGGQEGSAAVAQLSDRYNVYSVKGAQLAQAVQFPLTPQPLVITALCFIGIGGLYVGSTMLALRGKALVPLHDPRLNESLAFENS